MTLKFLSEIGKDATMAPYVTDFRKFSNRITVLFHDQPMVGRMLAPRIKGLDFDGMTEDETPTQDDIERPEYSMQPEDSNVGLKGSSVIVKTPQIFQTAELLNDTWKLTFAGNARMPRLVSRMIQKLKVEEDLITFQGRGPVKGLISDLTTDLGPPAGNWKTDADGDGILEVAFGDIHKSFDAFDAKGIGHLPIDIIMTPALGRVFRTTVIPYDPATKNWDILMGQLNGGNIHITGNLQDAFSTSSNTFVAIARTGEADAAWEMLSSGLENKVKEKGLWKTEMGIREKFAIKILDGDFVQWMDGITVA